MNIENRMGRWSVIFGIVIVLNLFFNYTISLVYERPDYEAYCPVPQVVVIPDTQAECVAEGGQWTENQYYGKPVRPEVLAPQPEGYCDLQYTCRQEFENANDTYSRNVFVVLVVLGALSVLAGNFFRGNAVITGGLSLAGLFSFIIASIRYWGSADNLIRVIILAIALGILIFIAMKKFNDRIRPEENRG
jgi:hypothetical protein